jgi:hypothetical protein
MRETADKQQESVYQTYPSPLVLASIFGISRLQEERGCKILIREI